MKVSGPLGRRIAQTPASHLWKMVAIAVALLLGMQYLAARFIVGHDPQGQRSLKETLYVVDRHAEEFARGEYAAFRAGRLHPEADPDRIFVKRIEAVAGDRVRVADGEVFVRGQRMGSVERGAEVFGAEPGTYARDLTLAADQYWMMGSNDRSFDSRYFGPVADSHLVGKVYPIY